MSSDRSAPQRSLQIMHGGPFFGMQRVLGLVRADSFRTDPRVTLVVFITFLLPLLAAEFSHHGNLKAFIADPGVWAKFLIAPAFFLMAEPSIERSVDRCVATLFSVPMISDAGINAAEAALNSAIRLRNSTFAELGCGMLAAIIATLNIAVLWKSAATHWAFQGSSLAPAGWLCLAIGNTLFWFLLFRLIWRHVVWSVFANKISKCGLRIVVSHPDGHASLSFLTVYPTGYTFFTLGVSSVVAAGLAQQLHASSLSFSTFTAICTAWLVVVAGFFALPLVGFVVQIMRLKSDTIDLALRPILNRERSLERKMLGRNVSCDDPTSNEATGEDARQAYDAAIKCSALLLNKANVVPLLAGALLPIALVGLTQFPFSELGPLLKRLLFL